MRIYLTKIKDIIVLLYKLLEGLWGGEKIFYTRIVHHGNALSPNRASTCVYYILYTDAIYI